MKTTLLFIFMVFFIETKSQSDTLIKTIKNRSSESITSKIKLSSLPKVEKPKVKLPSESSLKSKLQSYKFKDGLKGGNVSLGADYGFLPYTINAKIPSQAFRTEGEVKLNVLNLPIDVNYFYTSQKNLIGLTNYFRINYNADQYKENLNQKLVQEINTYKNQTINLSQQQQLLMQKMAYADYLSDTQPDKWPIDNMPKTLDKDAVSNLGIISKKDSLNLLMSESLKKNDPEKYNYNDSTYKNKSHYIHKIDSLRTLYVKKDSIENLDKDTLLTFTKKSYNDSTYTTLDTSKAKTIYLKKITSKNDSLKSLASTDSLYNKAGSAKHKTDSIRAVYDSYKSKYDSLSALAKEIKRRIEEIEGMINGSSASSLSQNPYLNKVQNILSGIKKLEIGLCYPNYSTFLTNNIPVRGINVEYGKNNSFFAFTYGTTVNNLLNNRSIEGVLQNVKNTYNYFDFNNVALGRKIVSAKFGIGSKEGNHLFVGFLIGKGQSSYLNPTPDNNVFTTKESNLVLELDGKYKLNSKTSIDLIIGKSSLRNEDLTYDAIKQSFNEILSNYRSYAALARLNTKIIATKTNLSFSVRWIDPFFKNFGIGFLRSDNIRYELKLDQPVTNKLRYTVMFRYEEDNLLRIMNYKNMFYSVNNTLSYKIKRGLMARISYTPLVRTLRSEKFSSKNTNSIFTGVITYVPKAKRVISEYTALYNYYLVNTDSQQVHFQNFAYSQHFTFKNGFKAGLNVSWYKNNLVDSLNNNVLTGLLDAGYIFKNKTFITAGVKSSYALHKFYPGFIIKANVKIYKTLFWENQVEKFVVGDLFNGYDLENLKKFPYYFTTRFIYNF